MRPDIVNLRQFYSSRLGRKVKARLRQLALEHWPMHTGETLVGFGYATPVLRVLERAGTKPPLVVALMPAAQGAIYWPVHSDNQSVLADELRPPFAPNSLQRIVMMHALEHTAKPDELLSIAWQLLAPGGRLLLVVPNQRGLWVRFRKTPFASGTAYTMSQLESLLHDAEFTWCDVSTALYAPPSEHPFWLRSWPLLEWLGHLCFPRGAGVLMVEAEKQIYAAVGERKRVAKAAVWQGAPASI